jgi:hypothetical protein
LQRFPDDLRSGPSPSGMDGRDSSISGIGQENRVAIGGSDRNGHERSVGHQGISLAGEAWAIGNQYPI